MIASVHGIPQLGLGTWGRTGDEGMRAMLDAMQIGYRHFDTAQSYGSEEPLGRAIKRGGVQRADLFITTKVASANLARDQVGPSIAQSLERLGVEAVDLLLIHWPSPGDATPFADYMEPLAQAKARGQTARIGVSNFPIALIERAVALLGAGAIVSNQVECHPFLQNRALRAHCAKVGVAVTAYCPIAKGKVADDPVIRDIAKAQSATPAQIALAFLMAEGLVCIPASGNHARMAENFGAAKVTLSKAEIARLRGLDRGERIINPSTSPAWDA